MPKEASEMNREEYSRGVTDYEGREREYNRDFDRGDYNRGYESRGPGRDYEMKNYGRGIDRDYNYERNFGTRDRMGMGRDFDEDRGFGYGRSTGYQGNFGYMGEGVYGQNWAGRNYSPSGYVTHSYSQGMGYGPQYGMHQSQKFYGHRNDDEIEREVYDRLDNEWQIPDNADIKAQVKEGVVTLTGTVRNRNAKMAVWNSVWQVPGVEDVHNNIIIQSRRRQNQEMSTSSSNSQQMAKK
jgi:osmotically-inducible protein OsmY